MIHKIININNFYFLGVAHEENEVYWYNTDDKSFGFSNEITVNLTSTDKFKKDSIKEQLESELEDIILNNVSKEISTMLANSKSFSMYLKKVQDKKMDPYDAADKLTKGILK